MSSKREDRPDLFTKKPQRGTRPLERAENQSEEKISEANTEFRNTEDKIAGDKRKDEINPQDYIPGKEYKKQVTPQITTTGKEITQTETKGVFTKAWTVARNYNMTLYHTIRPSGYAPNGIAFCETLFKMEDLINQTRKLTNISPFYFSLPVRVYYTMMFTVAILNAKSEANKLTNIERSWLKKFKNKYRFESLPIAGPLFPIFVNLAACLPDDATFSIVHPHIYKHTTYEFENQDGKGKGTASTVKIHPEHFTRPSLMLIADFLKQFCEHERLGEELFNEHGEYIPFRLSNGGNLGGIIFPPADGDNPLSPTLVKVLLNPIMMRGLPEDRPRLLEVHPTWRRSLIRDFPTPNPTNEFRDEGPPRALGTVDDFGWFEQCIDAAAVQATFFENSTNMSNVSGVGGISTLIEFELKGHKDYETLPTALDDWYPNCYSEMEAQSRTRTATIPESQVFNAVYSLTNMKLPWKNEDGKKIGSRASGMRHGPYWESRKFNYIRDSFAPVMTGVGLMIRQLFFNKDGEAEPGTE